MFYIGSFILLILYLEKKQAIYKVEDFIKQIIIPSL